ncbi:hypothetical protein CO665_34700 [Rhizobium anhuiense]|uniref:hypothetical protein n=1 Tax=Rhizobium anhuiense TaxID=1184720 RepID=UPI000BE8D0F9|nr:hypothetical protein [Rhizobium anhuiense]PDS33735.1 hypothetical protein CO665_34700 [Rhizobium anhuiense]
MRAIVQPLEKYLSFGALGGLFGVCNDIAAPLAGTNIYGVLAGGTALAFGFLSWATLGRSSDITKGLIGVGGIMTICSLYFLAQTPPGPEGDDGFLASKFELVSRMQTEMMGKLDDIHVETQKIVANTETLIETTGDLRGYSISEERFDQALSTGDKKTVVMACKSGLRATQYIFFGGSSHDEPVDAYRDPWMVRLLVDQGCVPQEKVCRDLFVEEPFKGSMAQFAIHDRVAMICGTAALEKVKAVQVEYAERMSKPFFQPLTSELKFDVDEILPKTE